MYPYSKNMYCKDIRYATYVVFFLNSHGVFFCHLESRWRNSPCIYHGPLQIATFWGLHHLLSRWYTDVFLLIPSEGLNASSKSPHVSTEIPTNHRPAGGCHCRFATGDGAKSHGGGRACTQLYWRFVRGGTFSPGKTHESGWVVFKGFLFSPRKLGKMNPFWTNIFQRGWFNHQLGMTGWFQPIHQAFE